MTKLIGASNRQVIISTQISDSERKGAMPNNLKAKQRKLEARAKAARQEKVIRIVSVVFVALVIVGVAWAVIPSLKSDKGTEETPASASGPGQYDAPPPMTIDVNKQYFAAVKMEKGGEFIIQLFADKAPITVNNFVFLAREGFYNGVTFHRVIDGFMAQGGDPTGTGMGGPGYEFQNELNDLAFDKPGVVAMANAGPDTNGSQFFIMFDAYPLSGSDYTIFGQVVQGMDVVNGITRRDPDTNPNFEGDRIESVVITEQ